MLKDKIRVSNLLKKAFDYCLMKFQTLANLYKNFFA